MMKVFIILFFVFNIFIVNIFSAENWNKINEIIQSEKEYLLKAQDNCLSHFFDLQDSNFIKLLQSNEVVDTISELNAIVSFLKKVGCCKSKYCRCIIDEKIFLKIISILEVVNDEKTVSAIYEYIYFRRNITYIKKYSNKIKSIIKQKPCGELTLLILLMCEVNDNEKEKLSELVKVFYKNSIPDYIRIILGETQVEDTILKLYQDDNSFESLKEKIKQIELAGTEKCKIALVRSLGTKDLIQESSQYSYSIRYFIIEALGRLHPEVALLNDDFQDYISEIEEHPADNNTNVKLTNAFYEKLYSWIDKKYGIKINELKKADFLYSYELEKYYDEK